MVWCIIFIITRGWSTRHNVTMLWAIACNLVVILKASLRRLTHDVFTYDLVIGKCFLLLKNTDIWKGHG